MTKISIFRHLSLVQLQFRLASESVIKTGLIIKPVLIFGVGLNSNKVQLMKSFPSEPGLTFQNCYFLQIKIKVEYYTGIFMYLYTGLLIFRAVADPRNSSISAKSRKIPQKTRNTAKSTRNISKYMSAKHI